MAKPTILIVEDDPDDLALAELAMERTGLHAKLQVARDGEAAIEQLFEAPGRLPDLVLLDVNLPGMSGFELLERIRAEPATALLPVVMLTTSREESDLRRGYELGANSYVRKPVDFTTFLETMEQLGLFWFGVSALPPHPRVD